MSIPTHFHGIPAEELHASCLALGLTMKAKASVVMALAEQQAQQAKEAAEGNADTAEESSVSPPPPPPPVAPPSPNDNFFVTMHPAITLRPITSCPASEFEDLQNKQPLWNILIDMLARHPTFLSEVLADTAASDAAFTGRMLSMYREIYFGDEGLGGEAAGKTIVAYQPNMLGIFRNDYMEEASDASNSGNNSPIASYENSASWKQVEINTISVSFAGLAPKVGRFHQQIGHIAKNEVGRRGKTTAPLPLAPEERIHIGESDKVVPGALAAASQQYLNWRNQYVGTDEEVAEHVRSVNGDANDKEKDDAIVAPYVTVVCFVIQENERNTTDQFMLSFEVETAHNVRCIRRTLREINESMTLVHKAKSTNNGVAVAPLAIIDNTYEVSLFYFRSCYTPTDFPAEAQWSARRAIELSAAIKAPSLPYYLCTFKKVQQIITGSRMRADGTPSPLPASIPSPTGTPTGGRGKDFSAALVATADGEVDHILRLLASIAFEAEEAKKARALEECSPTGRRRGANTKPFAVSAKHFFDHSGEFADDDGTSIAGALRASDAFDITYFTNKEDNNDPLNKWFTNWIRCNFVPIYSLNPKENPLAESVIADAIANPRNYVLKPQLEGGGNLYSGDEMVTLLRVERPDGDEAILSEPKKEFLRTYWRVRNEYILMRRINVKKHSCDEVMSLGSPSTSPSGSSTVALDDDDDASPLFRMGQIISKSQIRSACIGINHQPNDDLCSELGIYGVILSEAQMPPTTTTVAGNETITKQSPTTDGTTFSHVVAPAKVRVLLNDSAGYVIRSKLASVDDGGVMAGAAFLDSIALRGEKKAVSV